MRTWHRWLSVVLFVPLAFIAATGLLSHWAALWPERGVIAPEAAAHDGGTPGHERPAAPTASALPGRPAGAFTCPPDWRCRPAPPETGPRAWTSFFHHLHSGEELGPVGTAISILAGFGLLFFSLSGMWMYAQLWRQRWRRKARDRWFWR